MIKAEQSDSRFGPPRALPSPPRAALPAIRFAWITILALVVAIQLAGFAFALFDAYQIKPATRAVGFVIEFDDDRAVVRPQRADAVAAGIASGAYIERIGERRFNADASAISLSRAVMAVRGDLVPIEFRNPDGRRISIQLSRTSRSPPLASPSPLSLDLRMGTRLFFTLLCSLSLLGSSVLLLRKRPDDPVAILFGIGFLGVAAVVDPALPLWMALGAGWIIDLVTGLWWVMLTIALAGFPDGRFTPSWMRWSLGAAPMLGLVLTLDRLGDWISLCIGVGVPLSLLAAQAVRYRRFGPGRERQQIKWAALGFAAGFVLAGVSLSMSLAPYEAWSTVAQSVWTLVTVCLFNLAFAILPLGLLVSLIRFRLWDVDRVISRSAALVVVTTLIALIWAIVSDVTKLIIAYVLGKEHDALAVGAGAILVACVFAPAQKMAVQWSEQRFNPIRLDLERLPERLQVWRTQCDVAEVAARVLDVAVRALHAPGGVILARTPTGRSLIASRSPEGLEETSTPELRKPQAGDHVLELEDEDGLAGWLILGSRADSSRFPKSDLHALAKTAAPLSQMIRSAVSSRQPELLAQSVLDELRQRLATLEQQSRRLT